MLTILKKLTDVNTKNTIQNKTSGLALCKGNSLLQIAWPKTGNV